MLLSQQGSLEEERVKHQYQPKDKEALQKLGEGKFQELIKKERYNLAMTLLTSMRLDSQA